MTKSLIKVDNLKTQKTKYYKTLVQTIEISKEEWEKISMDEHLIPCYTYFITKDKK
jgi:hypothetical protein